MRVIKHALNLGHNVVESPHYCEPLALDYQHGGFVAWFKEFTGFEQPTQLQLYLATTGEPLQPGWRYVATATTPDRAFVVHLFQTNP